RLGRQAVVRCRIVSDAQPELAYREEPLVGSAPPSAPGGRSRMHSRRSALARPRKPAVPARAEPPAKGALDRPLCLLARPVPLEMASVVPQGPPIRFRFQGEQHEIAKQWGPERIETGWWRRQRAVRDYYRVETAAGRRFWLFRRRDDRWFLHGGYE
ncbi:MAG TPA: hypothetical protein VEQ85_11840, partial [Lacipirellulaceae bacterium]|nr:hypothetical protein [Lacipirellulaceae bacterium]